MCVRLAAIANERASTHARILLSIKGQEQGERKRRGVYIICIGVVCGVLKRLFTLDRESECACYIHQCASFLAPPFSALCV